MAENYLKVMPAEEKELVVQFMDRQSGRKIWKIAEFYNELMFRVPALEQAVRHKGRTYNYYWTMPGTDNMMSACHAMELSYVFRNPQVTIYTGGLYNEKLADTVQDMWVNFAPHR